MNIKKITDLSIKHPKTAIYINVFVAVVLLMMVAIPSLVPSAPMHKIHIDTDPENMLAQSEPVRVFHNQMKKEFKLYDMVVLGIVSEKDSIFNKDSLEKIYELTEYAKGIDGVVTKEVIAPSTVDSIESGAKGVVNFNWLMQSPIKDDKEASQVFEKASRIPFLNGTLISEDKKAIVLYIPIETKKISYKVSKNLKDKAEEIGISENVFITGLPVAQDQFGSEMFKQMAISAPMAMVFIFVLMLLFFKNIRIIISPMIVAMLSVIVTMGLLVATGNTIHIMSSMIPIFIMPIAVLDAVHILSDFFDTYHEHKNKEDAISHVMALLFKPMLFTSVTTVVGFASLAFTPIPPVQVFGIFVALGVAFAWLSTITFIPAFIMLMDSKNLKNFGLKKQEHDISKTANFLHRFGEFTFKRYKFILLLTVIISVLASCGVSKININDNPIKWFTESHEIRVADKALNEKMAGTYMAYIALDGQMSKADLISLAKQAKFPNKALQGDSKLDIINSMLDFADYQEEADIWYDKVDEIEHSLQTFKQPNVLNYIAQLQQHLLTTGIVGKSSSVVDVVKTVHRDLYEGRETDFRVPDNSSAVAQTLITYQSSHRPGDLWHFVTPDYSKANIWVQLKSGDNQDMSKVIKAVEDFQRENPAPNNIKTSWFGMTYINVVWQDKMVSGMMKSFLGSFLIVFLLMTVLFRSIAWSSLAMLPLTITIGAIYGIIGFIGKDYDMPIAVLSSLSLGLAIDYAIHFLSRARELHTAENSWRNTIHPLFGEPARAIFRNVIVISIGFVPLLFAPLNPYITVGIFISAILFFAGGVTLAILPAGITALSGHIFCNDDKNTLTKTTKIGIAVLIMLIIIQNYLM